MYEYLNGELGYFDTCDCCGQDIWEPAIFGPRTKPTETELLIGEVWSKAIKEQLEQPLLFNKFFGGEV